MPFEDKRGRNRYDAEKPLHAQAVKWDGNRSVRVSKDNVGLATTAYSFGLGYDELVVAAERIALLWNLHIGHSNEALRAALEGKSKE